MVTLHLIRHAVTRCNQQGSSYMYLRKEELKQEEIEDRGDASQKKRRRWRINGYRDDDTKIWSHVLVDKYNQPLYDVHGKYIPRKVRNYNRNETEIYYRNNPHKSHWKTNKNKRERNKVQKKYSIFSKDISPDKNKSVSKKVQHIQ